MVKVTDFPISIQVDVVMVNYVAYIAGETKGILIYCIEILIEEVDYIRGILDVKIY